MAWICIRHGKSMLKAWRKYSLRTAFYYFSMWY